jgi:hypothetical protein
LHQGLRTTNRLLRFPLADMYHPIVAFMSEDEQVGQDAAQARRIEFPALDELPDKTGMDPIVHFSDGNTMVSIASSFSIGSARR